MVRDEDGCASCECTPTCQVTTTHQRPITYVKALSNVYTSATPHCNWHSVVTGEEHASAFKFKLAVLAFKCIHGSTQCQDLSANANEPARRNRAVDKA